jgi:hypothetical protein
MDQDHQILIQKIEAQSAELAEIKASLKKIQNYFFWTMIITILVVVLPALGLVFAIPAFLDTFTQIQDLGL